MGESGLLKGAAQVFEVGKRSGDYHDNMDSEIFLRYIRLDSNRMQDFYPISWPYQVLSLMPIFCFCFRVAMKQIYTKNKGEY